MVDDAPPTNPVSFDESLSQARAGQAQVLGQLLEIYRDYLLKIASEELDPEVKQRESPSDLVQGTFLEAARDFPRFRGSSEPELRAWLRQILRHNVQNVNNRESPRCKREQPLQGATTSQNLGERLIGDERTPSSYLQRNEQAEAVLAALDRLSEDHRQVIILRQREGLSFEEIGQRMNRSADAARKLWARALEELERELLPDHEPKSAPG